MLLRVSANYAHSKLATGPYQAKSTIGVVDSNGELINVIENQEDRVQCIIVRRDRLLGERRPKPGAIAHVDRKRRMNRRRPRHSRAAGEYHRKQCEPDCRAVRTHMSARRT